MTVKNGLICLLIAAMVSLCVMDVTTASTSTPTTVTHNDYITDTTALQPTSLAIVFTNSSREQISSAKVNETVILGGGLWSGTESAPNFIGAAKINIQQQAKNGTWITVYTTRTSTGIQSEQQGIFVVLFMPTSTGVYSVRATYDGDSQYAPAVSNVATLTVS